MENFTVLCDMDEVLVDFIGGACKVHGVSRERLEDCRTSGQWDITSALAKALGVHLSHDDFWKPIHAAGSDFWLNLEPLSWAVQLKEELALRFGNDVHIVTSPSQCSTSYDGKVRWLKKFYWPSFDRFAITPHKSLLAKPNHILVDDREKNCKEFVAAGGLAILFPSRGNCLGGLASEPLYYVFQQLKEPQRSVYNAPKL